jgi:hypothetical protein
MLIEPDAWRDALRRAAAALHFAEETSILIFAAAAGVLTLEGKRQEGSSACCGQL